VKGGCKMDKNISIYENILSASIYLIYKDYINSVTKKAIEEAKRKDDKN
jgi:hypothetical protein